MIMVEDPKSYDAWKQCQNWPKLIKNEGDVQGEISQSIGHRFASTSKMINFIKKIDQNIDSYKPNGNCNKIFDVLAEEIAIE